MQKQTKQHVVVIFAYFKTLYPWLKISFYFGKKGFKYVFDIFKLIFEVFMV